MNLNKSLTFIVSAIFGLIPLLFITTPSFALEIGLDGEVPTLIKNSDLISGYSSNTLYISVPNKEDQTISQNYIFGINATVHGLYQTDTDQGSLRGYAYLTGWWPINPFLYIMMITSPSENYVTILSPFVGYSVQTLLSPIEFSFIGSIGLAYGLVSEPTADSYSGWEPDDAKRRESYELMKSINEELGCRINFKIKSAIKTTDLKFGFCCGFSQYVFLNKNFNTYDLGIFVGYIF